MGQGAAALPSLQGAPLAGGHEAAWPHLGTDPAAVLIEWDLEVKLGNGAKLGNLFGCGAVCFLRGGVC
jgi:hypothetical protein